MALSLIAYVAVLVTTALADSRANLREYPVPHSDIDAVAVFSQRAWTAPVAVALLVAGMYAATYIAFAIIRSLPVIASAASGH